MKNLLLGIGLMLSGVIGIVGTLIASAIGGAYGSARSALHLNLETLFLIFSLIFITGIIFAYKGKKETV